jgi:iron complex transport system permease protein
LTWVVAGLTLLIAALAAVAFGPARLDAGRVFLTLLDLLPGVDPAGALTGQERTILLALRAPRAVLGGLVGAMLALAGGAYQGVFRNPLADPYLLGAAAGAGVGATVAIVATDGTTWIAVAAFAGALLGVGLTYFVGRSGGGRSPAGLLLAGVAVTSFLTAVQTFVLQRNYDTLQEVYGFILGQLGTGGWTEVRMMAPYAVAAAVVILAHRRVLDVLSVGDAEAASLGLAPARVRRILVVAASLGTAAAVAVSGLIGFVGVIVPHTIRLLFGWSYRVILPLSVLFGAAFMMGADLIGRTVLAPSELPIGVVTAAFGAPFFLLVLRSARSPR